MIPIVNAKNYIIVKNKKELSVAKGCDICKYIVMEDGNCITIYTNVNNKWISDRYVPFGKDKGFDNETTGLKAYQSFYAYCGQAEVDRMKHIYKPIPMWESYEQMHYFNVEYAEQKIYKNIYELDANSAFTYGTTKLPDGFNKLKEYMLLLYENKRTSTNQITRKKYKNLQNYLIGYFARIKEFIRVRSEIIYNSNINIMKHMGMIVSKGGTVYLSNTDSIVTDDIGMEVMDKYIGTEVGKFKIASKCDKLFYKSPNCYQIGEKVVYSGVQYFARKHTDFFKDEFAIQSGSLIKPYSFIFETSEEQYSKICKVKYGEIEVNVFNKIGELLDRIIYKVG